MTVALIGPPGWERARPAAPPTPGTAPGTPAPAGPEAPPTAVPTTSVPPTPAPGPVRLAFAGDVHFEPPIGAAVTADPPALLADVAPVLAGADLAVVNLETTIGDRGRPEPKTFTFRGPPEGLAALGAAGVDVVSLANNHAGDFGPEGLTGTLEAARAAGLAPVGAGWTAAEAYGPVRVEVNGQHLSVVAATQVLDAELADRWVAGPARPGVASARPPHDERLLSVVRAEVAAGRTVVVYLHWGVERLECPVDRQRDLAARLGDAGAAVVVGTHAHRLQGAGWWGSTHVAYGLGNFVFAAPSEPGRRSGVLEVVLDSGGRAAAHRWHPARLVAGVPHLLRGAEADGARASWEALRACTGLTGRPPDLRPAPVTGPSDGPPSAPAVVRRGTIRG